MRIGIDARCLEEKKFSGVGEYALELVRHMLESDRANKYVIFSNSFRQKSPNIRAFDQFPNVTLKCFRWPNKLLNFSFWYLNWPKIDKLIGGVDIFFAPNINFLAISKKCKLAVTFHDLSFERYGEFFTRKSRLWHEFFVNPRKIARHAARIIAVSESTKRDLEEIYGVDGKKIIVARHGVGDEFRPVKKTDPELEVTRKKYKLPANFILYLGNIEPRKNIEALIKAFRAAKSRNKNLAKYKLVLAGKVSTLLGGISGKKDIELIGYVDRRDKPLIYNLADLFVYTSHFEGFGLPLLEAMACGVPVVASNSSSIPEVTGESALLTNPNKPSEMAQAIAQLLKDKKLRDHFKKRGLRRAKLFTWKKSAQKTLKELANLKTN